MHAVDPDHDPMLLPGPPYRLTEGGWKLRRTAPRLGQFDSPNGAGRLAATSAPIVSVSAAVAATRDPQRPPLSGLRVLDITTVWSGPLLTMHLIDLGAEVIRVESPQVFPPTTKGYTPRPDPKMLLSVLVGGYGPTAPGRPDRPYNRHDEQLGVAREAVVHPRCPRPETTRTVLPPCRPERRVPVRIGMHTYRWGLTVGDIVLNGDDFTEPPADADPSASG